MHLFNVLHARCRSPRPGADRRLRPAGDRIPGAAENVASLGVTVNRNAGWFGGARVRYLGEAPPGVMTRPQAPADHRVTVRSFPVPTCVVSTTWADMDSLRATQGIRICYDWNHENNR